MSHSYATIKKAAKQTFLFININIKTMKKITSTLVIIGLLLFGLSFNSCKKDKDEPELTASMSMEGHNRPAPTTVHFTNESENAVSYAWDFDDGETSDEENPTHEYTEPGSYTVTLEATSAEGDVKSVSGFVTVFGTLTGWEVDAVAADEEALTNVSEGSFVYLALYDNAGNFINYTGVSGQVNGYTVDATPSKLEWYVRAFDGAPVMVGMNESVTVKILSAPSNQVNPSADDVLLETTIDTQNDLIPSNDIDPYPFAHFSNDNNLQVDIDWTEAEK